jgi:hypothetical protein
MPASNPPHQYGAVRVTRASIATHAKDRRRPFAPHVETAPQDFRGLATIEAMRRFHREQNGWSDIAQHLTIDPQGGLRNGRNWNLAPARRSGTPGPPPTR